MALVVAGSVVRQTPGWPTGVGNHVTAGAVRFDARDGGPYRIAGTVSISGTPNAPVHRQVRLFSKREARLVREGWSDPVTGAYSFEAIKYQPYFVVAHDYVGFYDAVVHDAVDPEPMP